MLHRVASVAWLLLYSLLAASATVELPLHALNGLWVARFNVGGTFNLSLRIDTTSADLMMLPSTYIPSIEAESLHKTGTLRTAGRFRSDTCGGSLNYNLWADVVSTHTISIGAQTVVNETRSDWDYMDAKLNYSGSIGLSGAGRTSSLFNTKSFLDNTICTHNGSHTCRFGVALNSTAQKANSGSGTGALVLGGLSHKFFDGNLSIIPLDNTRKDQTNFWKGNVAQWWVRGDIVVNSGSDGIYMLKNQSIYLDTSLSSITGPPELVRELFNRAGIGIQEQSDECGGFIFAHFNCSSPPQDMSIRLGGSHGALTPLGLSEINTGDNGSGFCGSTIWV